MIPRKLPSKCVYLLRDPGGTPRYVGVTNNPRRRYQQHLLERPQTKRGKWMASLVKLGHVPSIEILEASVADWDEAERRWIATFRELGCGLVNGNAGGKDQSHLFNPDLASVNFWHGEQTPIQRVKNQLRLLARSKHSTSAEMRLKTQEKIVQIDAAIKRLSKKLGSRREAVDYININLAINHPERFAPKALKQQFRAEGRL